MPRVKHGSASCFLSHLTQSLDSQGLEEAQGWPNHYALWGRGMGRPHGCQGRRWPAALLDGKATDGIVIARDFWQRGAPRGGGGPGPNPKKGPSCAGFLWLPFSQAPISQGRKGNLCWSWLWGQGGRLGAEGELGDQAGTGPPALGWQEGLL